MKFRTINIGFTYDVDGLRTSKTIPNVGLEHKYYYVGDRLQYETLGGSSALWYFYDADGNPSGIRYKDNSGTVNDYYFVCNWRGDVIQIYNASGTLVGSYTYDAWGRVTENATSADTENITETNPIRYRGYYYDTETRLYYLKSRYYDPAVKRFLNADGLISTGIEDVCKNMFAYCKNDPVNMADSSGNDPVPAWALHIISGTATESEYAEALSVNPNAWHGSAGYRVRHAIELAKQHFSNKNNEFGRSKNKEFTQRKDKKKGSENRGKSGARERNVAHPNGEEHSRVPKGNKGIRRIEVGLTLASISAAIIFMVANDVTVVGIADDEMLPEYVELWWDTAQQVVNSTDFYYFPQLVPVG